jgi:lambda repressor-like predicted transcriptional regulator
MFANLFEDKKPQEIEIPADGISLDLLRAVYQNNQLPLTTRMRAAIAALPFEVPRLAVTAVVSEQDFAAVLDRRLKRIEEMKANAIEAKPVINGEKVDARLPDRRYRRI